MSTRRDVLFNILSTPFVASLIEHPLHPAPALPEIITEPHCLSEESANGFRLLLTRNGLPSNALPPKVIIVPGVRQLSRDTGLELLRRAAAGTWLIFETGLPFMPREEAVAQIRVLRDVFGLNVQHPVFVERNECAPASTYVSYSWPLRRLVRHFSMITPIECSPAEKIAEFGQVPVCAKRPVGKAGIVFLGSMLGPGLLAEERESHELGSALLRCMPAPLDLEKDFAAVHPE